MSVYQIASGVGFISGNGHYFITDKENNFELNINEEQAQQIIYLLHEIRLGKDIPDDSKIIQVFLQSKIIQKVSDSQKCKKEEVNIYCEDSNIFTKGPINPEMKRTNSSEKLLLSIYFFSESGRLWLCSQPLPRMVRRNISSISLTKNMKMYLIEGIQKNILLVKNIKKNKSGIISLDILDFRHDREQFSIQFENIGSYYLLQREFVKITVLKSNFPPFKKIYFRTADKKEYLFYAPNLNIAELLYLYERYEISQSKAFMINKMITDELKKLDNLTKEALKILKQIGQVDNDSDLDSLFKLSEKLLEIEKYQNEKL